jgi:hypothetical protein
VALFVASAMLERRQSVQAHRFVVPSVVGDVGPQEWPVMAMGRAHSHPLSEV